MKRACWLVIFLLGLSSPSLAFEYTVRSGDSLSKLANRYGVTVFDIKAANGLAPGARGDLIIIGQKLIIPGVEDPNASSTTSSSSRPSTSTSSRPSTSSRTSARTSSSSSGHRVYVVIRGDYLARIATRFDTTVAQIKRDNGLTSNTIYVGQRLKIVDPNNQPDVTIYHDAVSCTESELEVLARIVKGECPKHMPTEGQVAVAAVVLNRVRHERFPNTISGVAHQNKQFSCYNADVRNRLYWGEIPDYAWEAARKALSGVDPSGGATSYFNPYLVLPSWASRLVFVRRIGETRTTTHDFYRFPGPQPTSTRTVRTGLTNGLNFDR